MRIRKTQGVFVLAARHQHDLVAGLSPGMGQGALQQRAPPAIAAVDGVCHHILNDAIGAAGAREVGDDGQRAGRNQLAFIPPSKVPNAWVGERLVCSPQADSSCFAGRQDLPTLLQYPLAQKGSTAGRQSCMLMAVHPSLLSWLAGLGNHSFPNPGRMNNLLKHHT